MYVIWYWYIYVCLKKRLKNILSYGYDYVDLSYEKNNKKIKE